MGSESSRRRFLALAGVGAGLSLAGCTESRASPETTDDATQSATESQTERTTSTTTPMSTVFHFSARPETQHHAVANVTNLLADDSTPVENVVLVATGEGIKLLESEGSRVPQKVRDLLDRGAAFRACENSMDAFGLSASDLIDGVETVPAGVGELTKLQARDGYAYIETP